MKILWFDPGGGTGFARYVDGTITSGQLEGSDYHGPLWRFLVEEYPDILGYETFDDRIRDTSTEFISAEYIGVLKLYRDLRNGPDIGNAGLYVHDGGNVELVHQQPAQGVGKSAFWSDDKLEKLGLRTHPLKANRHANDAKRHLLYYITFTMKDQTFLRGLK